MPFGFELMVIALMLAFNAVFAAYEMALASISRSRIAFLVDEKKKGAVEASFMKDHMEASLAVIQLGITLVAALAAATGGAGVEEILTPLLVSQFKMPEFFAELLGIVIFIVPLTVATMIFGELVPKMFAIKNKEWVMLNFSPSALFFTRLSSPFINVIESTVKLIMKGISKKKVGYHSDEKRAHLHDLKSAVTQAKSSRLLGGQEERLIMAAAQLTTRQIRDSAIPASDIYTIPLDSSLTDALIKAHMDMHTRFPICSLKDDPQSIVGYVNFKDIVMAMKMSSGESGLKGIIRPIQRIYDDMTVSEVLEKMLREKSHISLVISNPENLIMGMVTLEDVMEELVGDMEDEYDRPAMQILPYGQSWLMGGGIPMTIVSAKFGLDWSEKYKGIKIPTLQEWCDEKTGHKLIGGEVIEAEDIKVVPRKFRRSRLLEAVVSLQTKTDTLV